jgi:hypothetical protein
VDIPLYQDAVSRHFCYRVNDLRPHSSGTSYAVFIDSPTLICLVVLEDLRTTALSFAGPVGTDPRGLELNK